MTLNGRAIAAALGVAQDGPPPLRRFRMTAVSIHRAGGGRWQWQPQEDDAAAYAALVFVAGAATVTVADGRQWCVADGSLFLHPFRRTEVVREDGDPALALWVPWDAVAEVEHGGRECAVVLGNTALTAGLRAFAGSVLHGQGGATQYTDYLVERLLAEMVFGALLEAGGESLDGRVEQRPIERARRLMLLRREDASFGVEELAQEMHLSTRQLQRIFAKVDSSPADELRRIRVEFAQSLLADPAMSPLSPDEIARHAGFTGTVSMRRAFVSCAVEWPASRTR